MFSEIAVAVFSKRFHRVGPGYFLRVGMINLSDHANPSQPHIPDPHWGWGSCGLSKDNSGVPMNPKPRIDRLREPRNWWITDPGVESVQVSEFP